MKLKISLVEGDTGVVEKSVEYDPYSKEMFYLEGKNSRVYVERLE